MTEIRISSQGWVSAALVGLWSLPQLPVWGWRAYTWQLAEPPRGFPCLGMDVAGRNGAKVKALATPNYHENKSR